VQSGEFVSVDDAKKKAVKIGDSAVFVDKLLSMGIEDSRQLLDMLPGLEDEIRSNGMSGLKQKVAKIKKEKTNNA
jgi:hypothetical protein